MNGIVLNLEISDAVYAGIVKEIKLMHSDVVENEPDADDVAQHIWMLLQKYGNE
jgi:hypothetical protein